MRYGARPTRGATVTKLLGRWLAVTAMAVTMIVGVSSAGATTRAPDPTCVLSRSIIWPRNSQANVDVAGYCTAPVPLMTVTGCLYAGNLWLCDRSGAVNVSYVDTGVSRFGDTLTLPCPATGPLYATGQVAVRMPSGRVWRTVLPAPEHPVFDPTACPLPTP